MGTDCKMITNKKRVYLDRMYSFSEFIERGKIYNKKDFIKLNFKCIEDHASLINDEEIYYNDHDVKISIYSIGYNLEAIKNSDELNMIVDDNDDRYFDSKFLLSQAQQDVVPKV